MSWSDLLRTRFYNMRRQPKLHAMGLQVSDSKPPKCLKKETTYHVCLDLSTSSTDQDSSIFEQNKVALKRINGSDVSTTAFLMKETLRRNLRNFK